MYVEHSQLKLPEPDSRAIWRYMDFSKFASILDTSTLFFCRADKFEDKWEGVYPKSILKKWKERFPAIPSKDRKTYTFEEWVRFKEIPSHLINCWHQNEEESYPMWRLYSEINKSIAIKSTIKRLEECYHVSDKTVWIGQVDYIDFETWKPPSNLTPRESPIWIFPFFLKRKEFVYENEIRAIINKRKSEHDNEFGIYVKVDLNTLIDSIYISPSSPEWLYSLVKSLLQKYSLEDIKIEKSPLGDKPYM